MNNFEVKYKSSLSTVAPAIALVPATALNFLISLSVLYFLVIFTSSSLKAIEPSLQTDLISSGKAVSDSTVSIRIQSHAMRPQPGAIDTISISFNSAGLEIAGFDFTLAYDHEIFEIISALPGSFPDSCDWEYFIERASPKCPGPCPAGLLKIVALARFKSLDSLEACLPSEINAELVRLILKRKSGAVNSPFKGVNAAPLRFFWIDCGDNSISSSSGNELYVASSVSDADGTALPVSAFDDFPNYTGPTESCFNAHRSNSPKALLKYVNAIIAVPPIEYIPARDSTPEIITDSL